MSKPMFWMVVGSGVPCYRHATKEAAKAEAERLARCNIGQEFTVLEAIATVVKSDLHWEGHGEDTIPF